MRQFVTWVRGQRWLLDLPLYAVFLSLGPNIADQRTWPIAMIPMAFLLPLLVRRRYPRTVALLILIGVTISYTNELWAHDRGRGDLAMAVVLYTLVKAGDRSFIAVSIAIAGLDALWGFTWGVNTLNPTLTIFGALPLYLAAWALGAFFRAREQLAEEERLRTELTASEERARGRAAVAEERTHIARELHDVLAHSMSVIVLNAEGAKLAKQHDPAAVDRALGTIATTGRAALGELRRMLEVMHAGEAARAPQPTLEQLRTLVAQAGREVTLDVTGDIASLPAGVALQAYRIVQEALTNMLKHAPPDATGQVRVELADPEVRVEIVNSGGRQPVAAGLPGSGRGLTGMAQRVELYHGLLETGALPDGGYRVAATLRTDAA
ncbi:sensor histidine kinase [Amycolatopsis benzoatilytica]|uniref:sensor histidine kinase n=1 Tax=Amycolatopsis benzoatilytica TaxID=346045 RepID=UPI000369FF46|nr:histidine kinase [Amycolatopsis benzoatilytica]